MILSYQNKAEEKKRHFFVLSNRRYWYSVYIVPAGAGRREVSGHRQYCQTVPVPHTVTGVIQFSQAVTGSQCPGQWFYNERVRYIGFGAESFRSGCQCRLGWFKAHQETSRPLKALKDFISPSLLD